MIWLHLQNTEQHMTIKGKVVLALLKHALKLEHNIEFLAVLSVPACGGTHNETET